MGGSVFRPSAGGECEATSAANAERYFCAFEVAINLPIKWPDEVLSYDARLQTHTEVAKELVAYKPAMDAYLEKAKAPV